MGRPRKTDAQRRAERFEDLYQIGKAHLKLTDVQVGEILGVTRVTLRSYRKAPDKLCIGDFIILRTLFSWSDDECASILWPGK